VLIGARFRRDRQGGDVSASALCRGDRDLVHALRARQLRFGVVMRELTLTRIALARFRKPHQMTGLLNRRGLDDARPSALTAPPADAGVSAVISCAKRSFQKSSRQIWP